MKYQTNLLKYFFAAKGAIYFLSHSNCDIFRCEDKCYFLV